MKQFTKMTLNINGADRMFICDPEKDTLASVLRRIGLTGTKVGCGNRAYAVRVLSFSTEK